MHGRAFSLLIVTSLVAASTGCLNTTRDTYMFSVQVDVNERTEEADPTVGSHTGNTPPSPVQARPRRSSRRDRNHAAGGHRNM